MPSLSDDIASKTLDKAPQTAKMLAKGADTGIRTTGKAIKGICLILGKGVGFTTKNVMNAVKEQALKKTGDIKYSRRNINIKQLSQSGTVKKIDDAITGDVMRHFDAACKQHGVKYCAMKDTKDQQNPQYYVFYEGRSADLILHVMEQAYKEYISEQQKGKDIAKEKAPEGLRAKLSCFRDRVAALDRDDAAVEKHRTQPEPQR